MTAVEDDPRWETGYDAEVADREEQIGMDANHHRIPISAKEDFLERLTSAAPINAIAELIWNGLDACSNQVEVSVISNSIGGVDEIRVQDKGTGIPHGEIEILFGNLGDSWKSRKQRFQGRALHGKSGQGRLKAFALGNEVTWDTTYSENKTLLSYRIGGTASALESLTYTDPSPATTSSTGTNVSVRAIHKSHGELISDNAPRELAQLFAPYLSQYPSVSILFNGVLVDPRIMEEVRRDIPLSPVQLKSGKAVDATVNIIEWRQPTKRTLHLCDANGVSLREVEPGIQASGFNFTAYVRCDHFRELDKDNALVFEEAHPDVATILGKAKDVIRAYFRKRTAERKSHIVERWKSELIYPYEDKAELTPIEEAERQVFDIVAVNVEAYLPKFEEADKTSKKFTFRLMAQALRENPESVQRVMTELLNLKPEEQTELATLLRHTTLSNIINSAKTVADRLSFLIGLENLLFDRETKRKLLERDQLHKILEQEAWLFDEEFALSGSEKTLEEVLQLHLGKLGCREEAVPVSREGDKQGRVDLMFSRVVRPRHDERDHLVVELKRPSKKIDSEVLNQIESYAIAVANDPRFLKARTKWRFIVVSNEIDEHARMKTMQRDRKRGLVLDVPDYNIQVWAYEWTEVISVARARLQFINETLNFEANRDSAKAYLLKAHARHIPAEASFGKSGEDSRQTVAGDVRSSPSEPGPVEHG
ncbi:MAG: ATP-binding protein [Magnetococcus sp. WYHC-3]